MKLRETKTPSASSSSEARTSRRARHILQALSTFVVLAATVGAPASIGHHPIPVAPAISGVPPIMDAFANEPIHLPPATTAPIAAPATLQRARMAKREVFAFAPYWNLDVQHTFDLRHITTLAYFGVDVAKNGSIQHSGNGWVGYRSQDLADLISRAHKAGIRVVLTIKAFNQDTIHAVAADAATRGLLVQNVIDATRAKNFDGVNIDFEGLGNTDRALFTTLARTLADGLHAADPAWQVTLDSYVSSAADSGQGFFDVGAIAPAIDSFFIMGYDMYQRSTASPNAPLPSYQSAIAAYLRAVPASKIVLGAPFYGYDWPTQDNSLHSPATGAPTPVTYEEIAAAGHPRYWDSDASVPWTAYQAGGRWHEVYYDDASSLALKARFANAAHLRGMGVWALGMNGSDAGLVAALLGTMTQIVGGPAGPAIASATAPSSSPTPTPHPASAPKQTSAPAPKPSSSPTPKPSSTPTTKPPLIPLPSL